jgi:uncharacterized surface protein with fasciclin (FAS1) repeats
MIRIRRFAAFIAVAALAACDQPSPKGSATQPDPASAGSQTANAEQQAAPSVPADPTNIVSIAAGSKDHTTLVAALKAADYIDSVSNSGPLTVFAPTNAAFDKLPKGTVEGLLKPEKQANLKEILKYHVTVSTYRQKDFHDGQVLSMADGAKATMHVKDGKVSINDANIIASIPASNGIVHVIDEVLLPPAK